MATTFFLFIFVFLLSSVASMVANYVCIKHFWMEGDGRATLKSCKSRLYAKLGVSGLLHFIIISVTMSKCHNISDKGINWIQAYLGFNNISNLSTGNLTQRHCILWWCTILHHILQYTQETKKPVHASSIPIVTPIGVDSNHFSSIVSIKSLLPVTGQMAYYKQLLYGPPWHTYCYFMHGKDAILQGSTIDDRYVHFFQILRHISKKFKHRDFPKCLITDSFFLFKQSTWFLHKSHTLK